MKYNKLNEEVFYTTEHITRLNAGDMGELVGMASDTQRNRVRLCTHEGPDDLLHEMFIIHERNAYVRPHMHKGRNESFHVLSGTADIVIFQDSGEIADIIQLGDYASGLDFYCRIPKGTLHMVIIRSDVLVFCEATTGPFDSADVEFPQWAPEDGSVTTWDYVANVTQRIEAMK